ncbi:protein Brevis radix-like 4 isoform X2 [Phoenix dactylifera]|nr:protein Brevis radix-like 4 isoform X2 [Phoenix dactylifera]
MSSKVVRVQRRRKPECSEATATMEAKGEEEEKEWVAEPEGGVLITLMPLPNGGNLIKKIRFSAEMFDALAAQNWWSENFDRIVELYSISQSQIPQTPSAHANDENHPIDSSQVHEVMESARTPRNSTESPHSPRMDPCSSAQEGESSTMADPGGIQGKVVEWVVEDEPGVVITIHSLPDGSKELTRVELSRERFGEVKARVWWEENKARLYEQYV